VPARRVAASKQPVFVIGRGVISEKMSAAMGKLADMTGIPVGALNRRRTAAWSRGPACGDATVEVRVNRVD